MSRLSTLTNALAQLLMVAPGLTGLVPAQRQQAVRWTVASETPWAAGRIVWELLPPATAPPGAGAGVWP